MIGDWAGWLLFALTYLLIFFFRDDKHNIKLLWVLFFILSLHHAVALVNAYITPTFGANADAANFHQSAMIIAGGEYSWNFSGGHFYRFILAFFYRLFGPSLLLGEELSILCFLFSCFVFVKIYQMLGNSKHLALLLLLYGCLPSLVLMTSVTLRESWEILFFMLLIYFCLKILFFPNLYNLFCYIIISTILGLLHEGFVIFIFFMATVMIVLQLIKIYRGESVIKSKGSFYSIIFTICAGVIMYTILHIAMHKIPEFRAFRAISEGRALAYIQHYRAEGMMISARSNYGIAMDTTSLKSLLVTFISAFFYFMFAPFPWQISNMLDVYATFESFLRFSLILLAIIAWRHTKGKQRTQVSLLLLIYLSMSALWSLGTINYGTSIRHHLVSYWILILLFGVGLSLYDWASIIKFPKFKIQKINFINKMLRRTI